MEVLRVRRGRGDAAFELVVRVGFGVVGGMERHGIDWVRDRRMPLFAWSGWLRPVGGNPATGTRARNTVEYYRSPAVIKKNGSRSMFDVGRCRSATGRDDTFTESDQCSAGFIKRAKTRSVDKWTAERRIGDGQRQKAAREAGKLRGLQRVQREDLQRKGTGWTRRGKRRPFLKREGERGQRSRGRRDCRLEREGGV